jgi:F0F1-type ATP synthase membrane subunit a
MALLSTATYMALAVPIILLAFVCRKVNAKKIPKEFQQVTILGEDS